MSPARRNGSARVILLLLVLFALGSGSAGAPAADSGRLVGQFLVASPSMSDPRFARTVIYIVDHQPGGAMGLVLNRGLGHGSMRALLEGFGVEHPKAEGSIELHAGGPVEPTQGFVLHSNDFSGVATRPIAGGVSLSLGFDVLQAMASGRGPARRQIYLGYAGWGPGQLEAELARNDWLVAPADADLIFSDDEDEVWVRAMRHAGLSL